MNAMHRLVHKLTARTLPLLLTLAGLGVSAKAEFAFGGGNDTIGSLPLTQGTNGDPAGLSAGAWGAPTLLSPPRLVLTGHFVDLRRMVLGANGTGNVLLQPLDNEGLVRLTFQGDVTLLLDREVAERTFFSAHFEVGHSYAGGLATYHRKGQIVAAHVLAYGLLDMRLQDAVRAGVLDQGLRVDAHSPFHAKRSLTLSADATAVRIVQGS